MLLYHNALDHHEQIVKHHYHFEHGFHHDAQYKSSIELINFLFNKHAHIIDLSVLMPSVKIENSRPTKDKDNPFHFQYLSAIITTFKYPPTDFLQLIDYDAPFVIARYCSLRDPSIHS